MLYLCSRLEVARKGMRVELLWKKDVYERYLRPSNLANSGLRRYATGASTLGVLYSVLFFG